MYERKYRFYFRESFLHCLRAEWKKYFWNQLPVFRNIFFTVNARLYFEIFRAVFLFYFCGNLSKSKNKNNFSIFHIFLQCSFSNGGHYFATVHGNVIQLYSTTTFENVGNLKGHNGKVVWDIILLVLIKCIVILFLCSCFNAAKS